MTRARPARAAEHDPNDSYDPRSFPPFAVTVDVVVLSVQACLSVLTVERGVEPFAGRRALPGGFVRPRESLDDAAWRELREETGLRRDAVRGARLEQLGVFGAVRRDPRMRVVSVAYVALTSARPQPVAGTDAVGASWVCVADLSAASLAFDHGEILSVAVERVRSQLEHTTVATVLAGPEFTMGELQHVYETVWGVSLERANFRRKVLGTPGFVEPTGARRESHLGGAPAAVYRGGPARPLMPPMYRPRVA